MNDKDKDKGVSKSLQFSYLKTDDPLRANFRRIKQGGIPTKDGLCENICRIQLLKPILFCRTVPKYAEKTCEKQHKKHSFSAYILAEI